MADISICICTFKRPQKLEKLLLSLLNQNNPDLIREVVVVDNDSEKSGEPVVQKFEQMFDPVKLFYDVEPEQNIAMARNRSVASASGKLIAFIDDDETADKKWISNLYLTLRQRNADAVFGPVIPVLPPTVPAWIQKGAFFSRPEYVDGTEIGFGGTGNALVKAEWMKADSPPFEKLCGLTGGEDTVFFRRIKATGAKLCWSQKAKVFEHIEENRLNAKWLILRAFRGGQGYAALHLKNKSSFYIWLYITLRFGVAVLSQMVALTFVPVSYHRFVWWQQKVCSNLGQFSSIFKYRYEEYK